MSKLFKLFFSRAMIVFILLLLQIITIFVGFTWLGDYSDIVSALFYIFSILVALYILTLKSGSFDVKLPWVVLVLVFPVFGSLFYLLFNEDKLRKKVLKNLSNQSYSKEVNSCSPCIADSLKSISKNVYQQSNYIFSNSNMPVFVNSKTKYFKIGEEFFETLLFELEKAKSFIFLESFIISDGIMWNSILEVLKRKAANGIEVRVIFDDWGTIRTLPYRYDKYLERLNIKCVVFNPLVPVLSIRHNNRDHKKIVIIDGNVAFTGGINFADEYINQKIRFGHWKDSGIMVKGEAVQSFVFMFLESWHCYRDRAETYIPYMPTATFETDGFVQPYQDSPIDSTLIGRDVYVNILNNASDYVYITTPYLITDPDLLSSILAAAKRGVDVKIITPHVPDKWYVHLVTQSHYPILLNAGVKVYEYTPGFIHAKNVVCDDLIATVGTVNFDYRSLYHNYECGVWMCKSSAIADMKKDFEDTLEISTQINSEFINNISVAKKIVSNILKFFSPLF